MDSGWIKLHRKLREWPYYAKKDGRYLLLWLELLFRATYKERDFIWCGERITLQPGQFVTSRSSLASAIKCNEHFIYRTLKRWETEEQIEQVSSATSTLITIVNWDDYQDSEQLSEQPVSNDRATSEQPVSTNKKLKNVKEGENGKEKSSIPFGDIVGDLNLVMNTSYKSTTANVRKLITARWNEGFMLEHFKLVHRNMFNKWSRDPRMKDYLRPQTLYTGKFESYLMTVKGDSTLSPEGQQTHDTLTEWLQEDHNVE